MSEIYKSARLPYKFVPRGAIAGVLLALVSGCGDERAPERGMPSNSGGAAGSNVTAVGGSAAGSSTQHGGTSGDAAAAGAAAGGVSGAVSGGSAGELNAGGDAAVSGGGGAAGSGGAPLACSLQRAAGVAQLSLMSGGLMRKLRLFVPSAYDGQKRLPLLLNLHGSSDAADSFAKSSQMEQVAETEGFVVAGLEAVAGQWNVPPTDDLPDDVKYASDAIDLATSTVCIDPLRVYASGFSGGGRMSSRLGCVLPDKIAGIGPVAGVRWPAPCPGAALAVIAIHGLADTTNAYAGEGPEHPRWNESVEDAVLGWATKDGCDLTKQIDDPAGPLSTYLYTGCQKGVSVKLVRMDGVEHAYPTGTPLHAAKEVWGFLKQFSR
jgi:polyhydroxybutyrate depolymerase